MTKQQMTQQEIDQMITAIKRDLADKLLESDGSWVCAECGCDGYDDDPCDCDMEYEDDGQPSEYDEWQDYMGGDDWDHGQYDEY